MRIRKLLNQLLRPTGYLISKRRDLPRFTERRVFESMVRHSPRPQTILDVGGNVGQTAQAFAQAFPEAQIYSFEPFQATFDQLCANVRSFLNIRPFRLAAGSSCGAREVLLHPESAAQVNSLATAQQNALKTQTTVVEKIELVTLDRFCQDQALAGIDLKTDTEGYDLEVLTGAAGLLTAGKINAVICEVGMTEDLWHTDFFEVAARLKQYGLAVAGFYETDYQPDGRFSHTNALFVRRVEPKKI